MSRIALFRAPVDPAQAHVRLPNGPARVLLDPCHIDLSRDGVSLRVTLRRHPTARKMNLRVRRRDGEVVMTLPREAEITKARGFAESCFEWIAARVSRHPVRVPFAPGSEIPLRGEHCVIAAGPAGGAPRIRKDRDGTRRLLVDPARPDADARDYLRRAALSDLTRSVRRYAAMLGVSTRRIQLKDTASRWGSCSVEGDLCFSWRLVLAPTFVLDYLAAHEVGHLVDMTHSPAYWERVRGICPRTEEAEAWLRENGPTLYSFG